jgi:hypothetical protein
VRCELDTCQYPKGIVVTAAEMAAINIKRAEFHGDWNYTISLNTHPPNGAFIFVTDLLPRRAKDGQNHAKIRNIWGMSDEAHGT